MCIFPSWIEAEDGAVYFLTDKDVRKYLRTHPEKGWEDMIGHSAIEWVMPEVSGMHKDSFPCPPQVARAIIDGRCNRMMRAGEVERLSFNEAGELHSFDDKPARIWADGTREWWWYGKRHRENDQPAIIWADGTQEWWWDGKLHRENDQPAIIWASGTQEWWRDGKYIKTARGW